MQPLLIALLSGVAFLVAYHTYGRWLGRRVFRLAASTVVPSHAFADGNDYVPTKKSIVFGHHFTSIAGTGPIVGPAIAIMYGWVPALLWVILGSIFIGAVHDFGSLVVSLRNRGRSVGDIAGDVINKRARLLFLCVLFLCLLIVIAIFGLVIAAVFKQYPQSIFPCLVQGPIALAIGLWLHRHGKSLTVPSILALAIMYATTFWGDVGVLHDFNQWAAAWPNWVWIVLLLAYGFVASVLPVWVLLQPRDYINSLQLLSALGLIVVGLIVASLIGGAPPVEGAERVELEMVAPAWNLSPAGAPPIWPFLFITIACGAVSGFHCLVSSGTSSKQLENEPDARFVGYGAMLTEGFLAVLVILACGAGLGLGLPVGQLDPPDEWTSIVIPHHPGQGWEGKKIRQEASSFIFEDSDGHRRGLVVVKEVIQTTDPTGKTVTGTTEAFEAGLITPQSPHYQRFLANLDHRDLYYALNPKAPGAADLPLFASYVEDYTELSPSYSEPAVGVVVRAGERSVFGTGGMAWRTSYQSWQSSDGLAAKVGAFVTGAGNFVAAAGVPRAWGTALMAVLVASFALTTLDTAVRLQRYVVQELVGAVLPVRESGPPRAAGAYAATAIAIVTAAALAAVPASGEWTLGNVGTGGMILWPLFGATNQLLAGLAFAVILFYLRRRRILTWFLLPPMAFMLVMPAWAMLVQLPEWWESQRHVLAGIGVLCLALETWMVIEAALMYGRVKGVPEGGDGGRGFKVVPTAREA